MYMPDKAYQQLGGTQQLAQMPETVEDSLISNNQCGTDSNYSECTSTTREERDIGGSALPGRLQLFNKCGLMNKSSGLSLIAKLIDSSGYTKQKPP